MTSQVNDTFAQTQNDENNNNETLRLLSSSLLIRLSNSNQATRLPQPIMMTQHPIR